ETDPANQSSFSFLYVANVMGAMTGTAMTALVLVELFGFRSTSVIAATINCSIAVVSLVLGRIYQFELGQGAASRPPLQAPVQSGSRASRRWLEIILFTTGFPSLAMEVAWTRPFPFVPKTTISVFAMILAPYLLSTWVGSSLYRRNLKHGRLVSTDN